MIADVIPEAIAMLRNVPVIWLRAGKPKLTFDAPHVVFHPGWMSARHKQSFYVTRSTLILNALMGNVESPGGCILGKI